MMCVTPADLGKPIAAIVQRCGAPDEVASISTANNLVYVDGDHSISVCFDADQMRVRVIEFFEIPPAPSQPLATVRVTLPFESGARAIVIGQTRLADAQQTLAVDADVTTDDLAAFRSTEHNEVVLAALSDNHVLIAAFIGERAALVQQGILPSPLGESPLDYRSPIPLDAMLRPRSAATGPQSTIFRIDVDAYGIVRNVAIVIPSHDSAFDTTTQQRLGDAKFHPATLGKRRVSGTSFVQVRH